MLCQKGRFVADSGNPNENIPSTAAARTARSPPRTTPARSPSSRVWTRSASDPACTSGRPVSAACTTSCRRSSTTPSTRPWPGTRTPSTSRSSPTAACASIDNGRGIPVGILPVREASRPSRSCSPCCTRAASSAAAATPSPAVCTASASPSSTRCPRKLAVEVQTDGYRWTQDYKLGVPTAPLAQHEATEETGTTVTFWADARRLRDHRLLLRDALAALPGDGVPQQGSDHQAHRRARGGEGHGGRGHAEAVDVPTTSRPARSRTTTRAASSTS